MEISLSWLLFDDPGLLQKVSSELTTTWLDVKIEGNVHILTLEEKMHESVHIESMLRPLSIHIRLSLNYHVYIYM